VNEPDDLSRERNRTDGVLRMLREQTTASIAEIAGRFQVSEMTIRRDIQRLSESGQVIRVPGGARIERSFGAEKHFHERLQRMVTAKQAIGKAAASLVKDGESLTLDSGTTTLHLARALRRHRGITVFTFSLAVLEELSDCENIRVEMTGGAYRRSSHDLIGNIMREQLAKITADRVFFGAAALSRTKGIMVYDTEAAHPLLHSGRERILVIDSSKINQEATYGFCGIEDCDLIVTDRGIARDDLSRLKKQRRVIVAE